MKKFLILILSAVILTSCSAKTVNTDIKQEGAIDNSSTDTTYNVVLTEAAVTPDGAHGGSGICTIHTASYHGVPGNFIDYVGTDVFNGWVAQLINKTDGDDETCTTTATFPNYLSYFNITKEEFYNLYYNDNCYYTSIHDADILYSGDTNKIEKYYTNFDYVTKEEKWRNIEFVNKMNLRGLFAKEVNLEVNSDLLNARRTSIGYLISRSGVSKEETIKILAEVNERNLGNLDYDFDTIYNNLSKLAIAETLPSGEKAMAADDSIRIVSQ